MKHLFKALASFQQEVPVVHKATQGYGIHTLTYRKSLKLLTRYYKNTD
jgi:hypothetical protein